MTKQISYLVIAAMVGLSMISCSKEEDDDDDYSLYYTEHSTREKETTWNGWRIKVVSEFTLWYRFESKKYSGDKTFFFTHGNRTESITVKDIRPGESFRIGVDVAANEGKYQVNKISEFGNYMQYTIDYTQYSQTIKLWTDEMVVTETVTLPRRITSFDSFRIDR